MAAEQRTGGSRPADARDRFDRHLNAQTIQLAARGRGDRLVGERRKMNVVPLGQVPKDVVRADAVAPVGWMGHPVNQIQELIASGHEQSAGGRRLGAGGCCLRADGLLFLPSLDDLADGAETEFTQEAIELAMGRMEIDVMTETGQPAAAANPRLLGIDLPGMDVKGEGAAMHAVYLGE